jgi:hypothetical protein
MSVDETWRILERQVTEAANPAERAAAQEKLITYERDNARCQVRELRQLVSDLIDHGDSSPLTHNVDEGMGDGCWFCGARLQEGGNALDMSKYYAVHASDCAWVAAMRYLGLDLGLHKEDSVFAPVHPQNDQLTTNHITAGRDGRGVEMTLCGLTVPDGALPADTLAPWCQTCVERDS